MKFDPLAAPPLLTADLPGIGGRIKVVPEDFEVEEIPAYEPSGSGDFLYLWIEKRAMGAEYFVRQLARRLEIPAGDVGTAGLKDRQAIARQWVSVPAAVADRLVRINDEEGIRLLEVQRHGNKLRPGHLRGNRFRILVREVDSEAETRLSPLLDRLRRTGLPNYYGPQRFGKNGETVMLGFALLRGASPAGGSGRRLSPFLRRLALSAAQAALFNHALGCRLADGLLGKILSGDVVAKWPFGGLFVANDLPREQARFEARETVHTGPIFGRKMFPAQSDAAEQEAAVLGEAGLTLESFRGFGKLLQGTRRHNLVYLEDLVAARESDSIRLTFTLPAGSYATTLLHAIMQSDNPPAGEEA